MTTYSSIPLVIEDSDWESLELKQSAAEGKSGSHILRLTVIRLLAASICITLIATSFYSLYNSKLMNSSSPGVTKAFVFRPYSTVDPAEIVGLLTVNRSSYASQSTGTGGSPEPVFDIYETVGMPLPTNNWAENMFVGTTNSSVNNIFQIPNVIDTAGPITGTQMHAVFQTASDTSMITNYIADHGVTLGALEVSGQEYRVLPPSYSKGKEPLSMPSGQSVSFQWSARQSDSNDAYLRVLFSRGSPYMTMEYSETTPILVAQLSLSAQPTIDNDPSSVALCGDSRNEFGPSFTVQHDFGSSDATWLLFVSEPTDFICSSASPGLGNNGWFQLNATSPLTGYIRLALGNNCTNGVSVNFCAGYDLPYDQTKYMDLLRTHANVISLGSMLSFAHTTASDFDDIYDTYIDWQPLVIESKGLSAYGYFSTEVLTFSLANHREMLMPTVGSLNTVLSYGCQPGLYGPACPVIGNCWKLRDKLANVDFLTKNGMGEHLEGAIHDALNSDLLFNLPWNYQKGAGDTYFSGKMLAKLARIILIADELGGVDASLIETAKMNLKKSAEIWLNGSAISPMLYDATWKGLINCGCDYDGDDNGCFNSFPNCPGLNNVGINFGNGFYNDHHYHYGYHVYTAAVIASFDREWGLKYHDILSLFVRDIANPSYQDKFFTVWRHKDFYLGSSWASGVQQYSGGPITNGRNEESSSEAANAYEGVALFGKVFSTIFEKEGLKTLQVASESLYYFGRILLSAEIKGTRTFWFVMNPSSTETRIYPVQYTPNVIGNMWNLLMDFQTWFGSSAYLCYGIQMIPLTVSSEVRYPLPWLAQMIASYNDSCASSTGPYGCVVQGWSIPIIAAYASLGQIDLAVNLTMNLTSDAYINAGGNGHSLTNLLWWISTR